MLGERWKKRKNITSRSDQFVFQLITHSAYKRIAILIKARIILYKVIATISLGV